MALRRILSIKFVRKKRIYFKYGRALIPFCWIEFLEDGAFSTGLISKKIRFTEYGYAIQRKSGFEDHVQILNRGGISIEEARAPHYTFHPPKIEQSAGVVHFVDFNGKVDEWELDWFPVRETQHILTLYSGRIAQLGSVKNPKRNHSIIRVPPRI